MRTLSLLGENLEDITQLLDPANKTEVQTGAVDPEKMRLQTRRGVWCLTPGLVPSYEMWAGIHLSESYSHSGHGKKSCRLTICGKSTIVSTSQNRHFQNDFERETGGTSALIVST